MREPAAGAPQNDRCYASSRYRLNKLDSSGFKLPSIHYPGKDATFARSSDQNAPGWCASHVPPSRVGNLIHSSRAWTLQYCMTPRAEQKTCYQVSLSPHASDYRSNQYNPQFIPKVAETRPQSSGISRCATNDLQSMLQCIPRYCLDAMC